MLHSEKLARGAKQVFAEIKGGEAPPPPFMCVGTWPTRGVWGILPQESFNFRLSEITSGAFSDKYLTTKDICYTGLILQGGQEFSKGGGGGGQMSPSPTKMQPAKVESHCVELSSL